jgi:AraC family transcriptional activator of mtrCDE
MPSPIDPLSRLIELAGLQARLDLRCQFAGAYEVGHEPAPVGEITFHLVLQGACRVEVEGGGTFELERGDFLALPQGASHRVRSRTESASHAPFTTHHDQSLALRRNGDGAAELDLLCGHLGSASKASARLFASLPGALHASLAQSTPAVAATLDPLVALIREEVEALRPGALTLVSNLCGALFTLALRAHLGDQQPGLLRLIGDARLARAVQAMLADLGHDWSTEQLAELTAMSRATFMRHFGEVSSTTPGEFLTNLRLSRAAALLKQTQRSTGDIGMEVGYRSEAAFHRAFAKAMGATPAAFRKEAA